MIIKNSIKILFLIGLITLYSCGKKQVKLGDTVFMSYKVFIEEAGKPEFVLYDYDELKRPLTHQIAKDPSQKRPYNVALDQLILDAGVGGSFSTYIDITPGMLMLNTSLGVWNPKQIRFDTRKAKMRWEIEVIDSKNTTQEEEKAIRKYLTDKNLLEKAQSLPSGIMYVVTEEGNGPTAKVGDALEFSFIDSDLNGKQLNGSKEHTKWKSEYMLAEHGGRNKRLTQGLKEVLGVIRSGAKVTAIVPSELAYKGAYKSFKRQNKEMDTVPPFSPIVYDIHLKSVKDFKEIEDKRIQDHLTAKKLTAEKQASGIYITYNKPKKKGPTVKKGDMIELEYEGKLIPSEKIFDGTSIHGNRIPYVKGQGRFVPGFMEAIKDLCLGDDITVYIPSKLAYGPRGSSDKIPPFSTLSFRIKVTSHTPAKNLAAKRKKEEAQRAAKEEDGIQKYIKANNLKATKYKGIYIASKGGGNGAKPTKGQNISAHYTGKLLDGSVFDSSHGKPPFQFPLGNGRVIQGWDLAFSQLSKGEKATIIIPSHLGYGARGSGPKIEPYSTLIFDIELIDFK